MIVRPLLYLAFYFCLLLVSLVAMWSVSTPDWAWGLWFMGCAILWRLNDR